MCPTHYSTDAPLSPHETVLVGVPATEQAQPIVRRGVRLAEQLGALLLVLHVEAPVSPNRAETSRAHDAATAALQLARAHGAEVITMSATDVARAIVRVASERCATQLVMGEPRPSRTRDLLGRSITREVARQVGEVDIHLVDRRPG
jgi:two-component system sensor histidine kinase KdpD